MSDTVAVRSGEELDVARLREYLRPRLPAGELTLEQFPGGHSNLTYLVRLDAAEYVLRRAPLGPVPPKAHDMAREYRVLERLHPVYPKAPGVVHLCEDPTVIGAVFYLMERRRGVIYRDAYEITAHGRQHAEAIVDALIELHAVDVPAAGLADIGKPLGFVERQVSGWVGRWQQAVLPESPSATRVIQALTRRLPPSQDVTVVHNDFKLDNLMFAAAGAGPRVEAVLDWEMTTIGDPLVDIGLALCYWELGGAHSGLAACKPAGWLTRDEVVARYAARTGRDMTHVRWHELLGVFKLAVILQQIYVRYARGQTHDARFASFGERVAGLIARAEELAN